MSEQAARFELGDRVFLNVTNQQDAVDLQTMYGLPIPRDFDGNPKPEEVLQPVVLCVVDVPDDERRTHMVETPRWSGIQYHDPGRVTLRAGQLAPVRTEAIDETAIVQRLQRMGRAAMITELLPSKCDPKSTINWLILRNVVERLVEKQQMVGGFEESGRFTYTRIAP